MKKFELKPVNGKVCTEDQIQWMIEMALESAEIPDLHGQAFCTCGDTLVHVYKLCNGDIEVEVTERKSRMVIKKPVVKIVEEVSDWDLVEKKNVGINNMICPHCGEDREEDLISLHDFQQHLSESADQLMDDLADGTGYQDKYDIVINFNGKQLNLPLGADIFEKFETFIDGAVAEAEAEAK